MFFKKIILTITMLSIFATSGTAQPLPSHYDRNWFLQGTSSAFEDGLLGYANPANLNFVQRAESRFYWDTDGTEALSIHNWGVFSAFPHFGFAAVRQNMGQEKTTDYRLSLGFGSGAFTLGAGYGWGDGSGREKMLAVGMLTQPNRHLSIGLVGNFSTESNVKEGVAEIGIRPFGTPRFTLFADAALQDDVRLKDAHWSAGAAVELASGIALVGRTFDSEAFTLGFNISFGRAGIGGQAHFDTDRNHAYNSYMISSGGNRPSALQNLMHRNRTYYKLPLKGRVDYQRYKLFDSGVLRFVDLLKNIRTAVDDPSIAAIALNLSGMQILPEHAWELRRELVRARQADKKVVAFIDNASMTTYHLASVADYIVLDPQGSILLPGYTMGRTFFKGTLEKMGLAFDEWRFFKYKSAAESLSREKMSDADREQRQAFVDDWYELVRGEVAEGRGVDSTVFDGWVDDNLYFMPDSALAAELVDTLGRWSAVDEFMKSYTSRQLKAVGSRYLQGMQPDSRNWGEKPKIAIVYGLGICDMDQGIRARWLERVFLKLAKNKSVKAVVFRVDSPGGDGMASDLVAEAIKKCKEEKPVIISQGQVAGSGGYWISMYGDKIVAGPNTITGSIGVIGGWLYDKGLSSKLGMTAEVVQRGAHADLGFGVRLPFIGTQIPARNLNEEERQKMEVIIKAFYRQFLEKVADGRGLSMEKVEEIAQGHFYSGLDGLENGLVDKIGGLTTALHLAREQAGIAPDTEVEWVEIPKYKGLIDLGSKLRPIQTKFESDPVVRYIRMSTAQPGAPLPLLLPGSYPELE